MLRPYNGISINGISINGVSINGISINGILFRRSIPVALRPKDRIVNPPLNP